MCFVNTLYIYSFSNIIVLHLAIALVSEKEVRGNFLFPFIFLFQCSALCYFVSVHMNSLLSSLIIFLRWCFHSSAPDFNATFVLLFPLLKFASQCAWWIIHVHVHLHTFPLPPPWPPLQHPLLPAAVGRCTISPSSRGLSSVAVSVDPAQPVSGGSMCHLTNTFHYTGSSLCLVRVFICSFWFMNISAGDAISTGRRYYVE